MICLGKFTIKLATMIDDSLNLAYDDGNLNKGDDNCDENDDDANGRSFPKRAIMD